MQINSSKNIIFGWVSSPSYSGFELIGPIISLLEIGGQRRWTRAVCDLGETPYDGISFLLKADLILTYKIFHNLCSIEPGDMFHVMEDSLEHVVTSLRFMFSTYNLDARRRLFGNR